MPVPVWVLLGFAMWTLLLLAATVGVYRWSRILTRRDEISDFAEYRIEGSPWYRRALRAHANCVENLPVYGALVLIIVATGLERSSLDLLALVFLGARICHSLVHIGLRQTNVVVFCRSMLFHVQWFCMMGMAVVIALAVAI